MFENREIRASKVNFFNTFEDNFHTYVIREPCVVYMYGSWIILKTI